MPIEFTKYVPMAPAIVEEPVEVPNAAELKASAKSAVDTLFGEPSAAEPPPEPVVEPPVEPAEEPETPATPETPAEPEPEPQHSFSAEELISRTARETAEAMRRPEPTPATPAAPAPAPAPPMEMSTEDAEEYQVLQFLESQEPAKYAGKAKAFLDYVKSVYDLQDKWEKENPDKTWDPADAEHSEWFASHPVPVDRRTIESGLIDMKVEQRFQERVKPRIDMMDADKALEQAMPSIQRNIAGGILKLVRVAAPELAPLVTAADGKSPNLSTEAVDKVHEADAIAATILEATANELNPILTELEKSTVRDANGNYPFKLQPDKNQIHAIIDGYRWEAEQQMKIAPAEVQVVNGRRWVSIEQKGNDLKSIRASAQGQEQARKLAEYEASHWTLTVDNVVDLIADDYGKKARNLIQQTDALAKRKYKPEAAEPKAARPGTVAATPNPRLTQATPAGKPRSPSIATPTDIVSTRNSAPTPLKTAAEQATDVMFK